MLIAVFLAFPALICSCSAKKAQTDSQPETLTLGISKSFMSVPLYIAEEKGFFAKEGLNVTVKEFASGKAATQAMLSGKIDVSTVADMPIVFNGFKGADLCVLTTFTSSYGFVRLLARRDRGILAASDLKNKKIGANRGTSSHFYLGAFLTEHQLSMTDVEMQQYKTVDLSDALIRGEVDAISVWQPHGQKAKNALKENVINLNGGEIYRTTFNLAAQKRFAKKRGAAVSKMIRALHAASQFAKSNRKAAIALVAGRLNVEKTVIAESWEAYRFGTFLDQALLTGLDDIARWALENKFVSDSKIPNFFEYMCPNSLLAVYPEEVSMVH